MSTIHINTKVFEAEAIAATGTASADIDLQKEGHISDGTMTLIARMVQVDAGTRDVSIAALISLDDTNFVADSTPVSDWSSDIVDDDTYQIVGNLSVAKARILRITLTGLSAGTKITCDMQIAY